MAGASFVKSSVIASVVAIAGMTTGCQTTDQSTQQKVNDRMASMTAKPSMWDRMTGRGNQTAPPATPAGSIGANDFANQKPAKPGTPIKVETEVEFAETAFASAIDASANGAERDRRLDQARLQFTHILERDPKNGRAMIGLAKIYTETGDKDRASKYLAQYFETNPRDHKTAYDLAMSYGKKRDYAAAAAGCEYALSIDQENREYRKSFGFFTALSGDIDKAVGILTSNRTMTEAEARYNVAGILDQMSNTAAAKQQLQLSLQADPLFEPAKALLSDIDQNAVVPAGYQGR